MSDPIKEAIERAKQAAGVAPAAAPVAAPVTATVAAPAAPVVAAPAAPAAPVAPVAPVYVPAAPAAPVVAAPAAPITQTVVASAPEPVMVAAAPASAAPVTEVIPPAAPAAPAAPAVYTPAAPAANLPTVSATTGVVVANARPEGKALTMDDIDTVGLGGAVDVIMGLTAAGFQCKFRDGHPKAGLNHEPIRELPLDVNFEDLAIVKVLRYEPVKGQVTYKRSYDGVKSHDGKDWGLCIVEARQYDPTIRDYPAVEFIGTARQNIPSMAVPGVNLIDAGQKIGFTTSVTGWRSWQDFYNQLKSQGHIQTENGSMSGILPIKLSHSVRVKGSYNWGIPVFNLITA